MKMINILKIKLQVFMKIDNKKIENIVKKIFRINKVKNLNNLKIGSLKNWDSLGNFNLLLEIEKEFKIKFSNTDFTFIKSIKELKEILKKY